MKQDDIMRTFSHLYTLFQKYNLNFVMTDHAAIDRLLSDLTRNNIDATQFELTLSKLLQIKYDKFLVHKKAKSELEGIVTNLNNDLNIIFSIDFHKLPKQSSSGVLKHNFKIITAMVAKDFKSDNRPNTARFYVRA